MGLIVHFSGTPPKFLVSLYEKLKSLDNESQQKVLSDGNTVRAIYPIKGKLRSTSGVRLTTGSHPSLAVAIIIPNYS